MANWRSLLLGLGAVALTASCSIGELAGELTPGDCNDGIDNDEDGRSDCDDPDCQAFDVCGPAAPVRDASSPQIGDAYVAAPTDAAQAAPPTGGRLASMPPEDPPPATEPLPPDPVEEPPVAEPTCPGGCGENQTCVEGYCLDNDVVIVELWDITRLDAKVPRAVPQMGSTSNSCLDVAGCIASFDALFWYCTCPPDPKIQVWLDQDPGDDLEPILIATTDRKRSTSTATWSRLSITLGLLPSSKIHLTALDDDGSAGDELIFSCELPATPVLNGDPLECRKTFPPDAVVSEEFWITARVAPTQAPID